MPWLRWSVLALASLAAKALNYFLAPFVVPFASDSGWLPDWLSWFQTPDNSLDGDSGWRTEHWQWIKSRYIRRVLWLYRNSMYGFKIDILGVQLGQYFYYQHKGNQSVSDNPYTPGWVYRTIKTADDGQIAFQFYLIVPTLSGKCLRAGAGWKLWQHPKKGDRMQLFLTFNPVKSRG